MNLDRVDVDGEFVGHGGRYDVPESSHVPLPESKAHNAQSGAASISASPLLCELPLPQFPLLAKQTL